MMYSRPPQVASLLIFSMKLLICTLLLLSISPAPYYTNAHNITQILANFTSLSTFNHYLTVTGLATDINLRNNITVLVVENSAMSLFLSKQLSLYSIKNVISLNILVDYFGAKKLQSITAGGSISIASLYQASGSAPGTSGFVNITSLKGGIVGFGTDNGKQLQAFFVKSIYESPSNAISVQQISQLLQSEQAEAPSSAPIVNITAAMSEECKAFVDLVKAENVVSIFNDYVNGGITVFCPTNGAVESFMPKYNNLTDSNKEALLLFHALPLFESLQMLKLNNRTENTLASTIVGDSKLYQLRLRNEREVTKLVTKVATSTITGTVVAGEGPLAIYTIDQFLEPEEIFNSIIIASSPGPNDGDAESPEGDASDDGSGGSVVQPLTLVLSFLLFCILFV